MITIKTTDMANGIEIVVKGEITAEDIKDFDQFVSKKEEKHDQLNLLMSIQDMNYSLDGFIKDLHFDAKHWNDFKKIAVLSDKKWIEVTSKMVDFLPNVDVKHFDDRDEAMMWLK